MTNGENELRFPIHSEQVWRSFRNGDRLGPMDALKPMLAIRGLPCLSFCCIWTILACAPFGPQRLSWLAIRKWCEQASGPLARQTELLNLPHSAHSICKTECSMEFAQGNATGVLIKTSHKGFLHFEIQPHREPSKDTFYQPRLQSLLHCSRLLQNSTDTMLWPIIKSLEAH